MSEKTKLQRLQELEMTTAEGRQQLKHLIIVEKLDRIIKLLEETLDNKTKEVEHLSNNVSPQDNNIDSP